MFFEIGNSSFRTHFQALTIWGRNIKTSTPFMHLLLTVSFSCLQLIKTLQFSIPEINAYTSFICAQILLGSIALVHARIQDASKREIHSLIQLPRCYNWNWLLLGLFTVNLSPTFGLFILCMDSNRHLGSMNK